MTKRQRDLALCMGCDLDWLIASTNKPGKYMSAAFVLICRVAIRRRIGLPA